MTLREAVESRQIQDPRESPDGRYIAYIVTSADITCNCNHTALYVVNALGMPQPKVLLQDKSLSDIAWSPDSRLISFLQMNHGRGEIWTVNPVTDEAKKLATHADVPPPSNCRINCAMAFIPSPGITKYAWSHNGKMLAFVTASEPHGNSYENSPNKGILYDYTRMFTSDILAGDWNSAHRTAQLWIQRNDGSGRQEEVWETPSGGFSSIDRIAWSPDDSSIAFTYRLAPRSTSQKGLYDNGFNDAALGRIVLASHRFTQLVRVHENIGGLAWSRNGSEIYFVQEPESTGRRLERVSLAGGTASVILSGIYSMSFPRPVTFALDAAGHQLIFESSGLGFHRTDNGLYALTLGRLHVRRVTRLTEKVSDCGPVILGELSCVLQSPLTPPKVALINATSGTARVVTDVNPSFRAIRLNPVKELYWKNAYGAETNGYLILPRGYTTRTRLPLVILAYNFDGSFTSEDIPGGYPVQSFADRGIAVLLINPPRYAPWPSPDFASGAKALGYSPLSSIETIVHQLVARGIVDPRRVGYAGHSWGGFWGEFTMEQAPHLFAAVELHNGGTSVEPGTYWEWGNLGYTIFEEYLMGGPPFGPTLKNYAKFSPTLNARKARAPVLMEYDDNEALSGLEMYTALKHYHVPVDLFVYPGDAHVFEQPLHRYYEMQRVLDWFRFWLQGYEDPNPAKATQYHRWEGYRASVRRL